MQVEDERTLLFDVHSAQTCDHGLVQTKVLSSLDQEGVVVGGRAFGLKHRQIGPHFFACVILVFRLEQEIDFATTDVMLLKREGSFLEEPLLSGFFYGKFSAKKKKTKISGQNRDCFPTFVVQKTITRLTYIRTETVSPRRIPKT